MVNLTEADLRQMHARRDGPKPPRSSKRSKRQPWTEIEDATLRELASSSTPLVIAAHLGRTVNAVKARCLTLRIVLSTFGARRSTGGKREAFGGQYVRSTWEAQYMSYLEYLKQRGEITKWEYEPKTFHFELVKRGTRDYTPDFRVEYPGGRHEWHEVKGYMDQKSATRLKRMARYFPDERVVLIEAEWFARARRSGLAGLVPGWERGER